MLHAVWLVLVLLCICVFGVHFIGQKVLVVLSRWVAALAKAVLPGPSCCVCGGLFSHLLYVWWAVCVVGCFPTCCVCGGLFSHLLCVCGGLFSHLLCVCGRLFSHLLCVWWAVFPPAVCVWWAVFPPAVVGSTLLAATCVVVAGETAVLTLLFISICPGILY